MSLLRTIAAAALAAGPPLGAAFWAPQAAAQAPPPPGTVLADTLALYGKPVPLPPGPWRVAAAGFGQIRQNAPADPFGAIASVLLERPAPSAGDEKLLVQTNVLPVSTGWGPPPECSDESALFRHAAAPHERHEACAFVLALPDSRHLHAALPGLPAGSLPWPALLAGVRVSDRRDMLEIRYAVPAHGPDRAGGPRPPGGLDAAGGGQRAVCAASAARRPRAHAGALGSSRPLPRPTRRSSTPPLPASRPARWRPIRWHPAWPRRPSPRP